MADYIQIITTTSNMTDAQRIAQVIVEKRLAGCVQIVGPIQSTYRWEGEVQRNEEYMCILKTRADLYDRLYQAVKDIHPYEVPEFLATPVVQGNQSYLDWLGGELAG